MHGADNPRVPLEPSVTLLRKTETIQINPCRNPNCKNYDVPARTRTAWNA